MTPEEYQELATAFTLPYLPSNPRPFANALNEGLKDFGMHWIQSPQAKGIMFTLLSMQYGQLFVVDSMKDYNKLKADLMHT